jgi:hypothetical protein
VSALGLLLGAAPLAFAWSTGDFGSPPDEVAGVALNGRWIANWLVPSCVAAVLSYGTARAGVDHRLIAAGRQDLRTAWWSTHLLPLAAVGGTSVSLNYSLAYWTGETMPSLLIPCLVGVLLACCISAAVVTRWGLGPSMAMGISTAATAALVVLPYRVPPLRFLAADGTLARWMLDGSPERVPVPTAAVAFWIAVAGAIVLLNRYAPRDISGLKWIGREVMNGD